MNIFVLDYDPKVSAKYHNDKHVVKMIVETAQILSTVNHTKNTWNANMYKPAFQKHPCTIWASKSKKNYQWLVALGLALYDEYKFRYGSDRIHKAGETIKNHLQEVPKTIKKDNFTKFALAMPKDYHCNHGTVSSYRKYYLNDKRHLAKWTKRETPFWWK